MTLAMGSLDTMKYFSYSGPRIFLSLTFMFFLSPSIGFAKGTQSLTPGSQGVSVEKKVAEKKDKPEVPAESQKASEVVPVPAEISETPASTAIEEPVKSTETEGAAASEGEGVKTPASVLEDKLWISTSFGKVTAKKTGHDYRADGMGDIGVLFRVFSLQPHQVFLTFRYAPFDVAPQFQDTAKGSEYVGVVESYNLGSRYVWDIKHRFSVNAGLEFSYMETKLSDVIVGDTNLKSREDSSGINLLAGFYLRALEHLNIGPRLTLGTGSYSTTHAAIDFVFAF